MRYYTRKAGALLASVCIATTLALVHTTPASADCTIGGQSGALDFGGSALCPDSGGSSGNNTGGSSHNGDNDPRTPPTGKVWHFYGESLGPCGDNGDLYQGYTTWGPNGPIVDYPSSATIQCLEPRESFGEAPQLTPAAPPLPTAEELRSQAKLKLHPGDITSDYQKEFLFRADTVFSAVGVESMQEPLVVPGYHVWIEASPSSFVWDFGDGTTANGPTVTHRYDSKSAIVNYSDSGKVKVSLQVVWDGQLHINQIGPGGVEQPIRVDQLGSVPVESSIERSIIEVWAAAVPAPGR